MNKKFYIIFVLLMVVLIGMGIYYNYSKLIKKPQIENNSGGVVTNSLAEAMENINPFEIDVNPLNGYKNPFDE